MMGQVEESSKDQDKAMIKAKEVQELLISIRICQEEASLVLLGQACKNSPLLTLIA